MRSTEKQSYGIVPVRPQSYLSRWPAHASRDFFGKSRVVPSAAYAIWIGGDTLRRRLEHAVVALENSVEISSDQRGGVPVLRGTRVPVSRVLAELAENVRIEEFADDHDLDVSKLKELLEGLSVYLDRPFH